MRHSDTTRQYTTTLLLLALTAGAAAYIMLVERPGTDSGHPPGTPKPVLAINQDKIDQVRLRQKEFDVEMARLHGQWIITAPIAWHADAGLVHHLLSTLENLPRLDVITEEQLHTRAIDPADYGLADPRSIITLRSSDGTKNKLAIGDLSPLGNALYVQVNNNKNIFATATNLLQIMPHALEDLRERRLLEGHPMAISRIEIKRGQSPSIKIFREDSEWIIQTPVIARANPDAVRQLVEQVYALRISQFVSESMADPVAYGLNEDEATLQLGLWQEGSDYFRKIIFGKLTESDTRIFAAFADASSVFTTPADSVQSLPSRLNQFRDKRLYCMAPTKISALTIAVGGRILEMQKYGANWRITAPIQAAADKTAVADLVHRLNNLRAEDISIDAESLNISFDQPDLTVNLSENIPTDNTPTQASEIVVAPIRSGANRTLRVISPTNDTAVYARFDDDKQVFKLSPAAIAAISADSSDYRALTVMSVNPSSIQAITCAADGSTSSVERTSSGTWTNASPNTIMPPASIINRMLSSAAGLQALRFERGVDRDLAMYGLQSPLFSITLTLSGEEGIRKTIIGGQTAEDRGVFAMIQGQSGVFVTNHEIADLCRAFVNSSLNP